MSNKRRTTKPKGTLWPEEVHGLYGVAVATLSQWRWYDVGPKPIRVGKKFVVYNAEECKTFFRGYKPRSRKSKYTHEDRKHRQVHSKYTPTLHWQYMLMTQEEIANELNLAQPVVGYHLQTGIKRFKQYWAWFNCLVRFGLEPDEAVIFLRYPKGVSRTSEKTGEPVEYYRNGFREKQLHELLDHLLIEEDHKIPSYTDSFDNENERYHLHSTFLKY